MMFTIIQAAVLHRTSQRYIVKFRYEYEHEDLFLLIMFTREINTIDLVFGLQEFSYVCFVLLANIIEFTTRSVAITLLFVDISLW